MDGSPVSLKDDGAEDEDEEGPDEGVTDGAADEEGTDEGVTDGAVDKDEKGTNEGVTDGMVGAAVGGAGGN